MGHAWDRWSDSTLRVYPLAALAAVLPFVWLSLFVAWGLIWGDFWSASGTSEAFLSAVFLSALPLALAGGFLGRIAHRWAREDGHGEWLAEMALVFNALLATIGLFFLIIP